MTDFFLALLNDINGFLYGKFLVAALIGMGLYFSVRTRCVQLRMLPEALRVLTEKQSSAGFPGGLRAARNCRSPRPRS